MSVGLKTLVLNADYQPINLIPIECILAEDAVTRLVNGTCHVVYEYDRKIKTQNLDMNWPSIIARNQMDYIPKFAKLSTQSLYYRDHGLCAYCGDEIPMKRLTVDHVVPRSKGGLTTWENVVSSCSRCNFGKGDHLPKGLWEPKFARPYKPTYWQLLEAYKNFPITVPDVKWMEFIGGWRAEVRVSA